MNLFHRSWQRFSHVVGSTVFHPQYFSYKHLFADMRNAAALSEGILLDIGCGQMPYRNYFKKQVRHYWGLDFPTSPESRMSAHGQRPHIYATAEALPILSGKIDTILCAQVLEHIATPVAVVLEMSRVLKQGGTLLLSIPFLYPIHSAPEDYQRFTRYGICHLLAHNGFTVQKIHEHGGTLETIILFINLALMHKMQIFSNAHWGGKIVAAILTPIILTACCILNIIGSLLKPFDKGHRFASNYFVVATNQ